MRKIMLTLMLMLSATLTFAVGGPMKTTAITTNEVVTDNYYIFELSDNVKRTAVFYPNRFGITLAGDLYTPKNLDESHSYPALIIGAPYGGVKEQGPGVYANELAQRGFIVLTFDPSYNGESGGEPRHISSPEIFSEDFSAGVDFLGRLPYVDRERIGALGICGSGGFALSAAAMDARIKAVATVSMYDISMSNDLTGEERQAMLDRLSMQRWADVDNGAAEVNRMYPADSPYPEMPDGVEGLNVEWYTFYALERGWHPNAGGAFTATSNMAFMNYPLLSHIAEISPRPILFIVGENAHSVAYSERAYENASEPKELYVVPDAIHIDLYDRTDLIPFDKIEDFFKDAFGMRGSAN